MPSFGHEHDFCQAEKAENTDPRTNYAVKYASARGLLIHPCIKHQRNSANSPFSCTIQSHEPLIGTHAPQSHLGSVRQNRGPLLEGHTAALQYILKIARDTWRTNFLMFFCWSLRSDDTTSDNTLCNLTEFLCHGVSRKTKTASLDSFLSKTLVSFLFSSRRP